MSRKRKTAEELNLGINADKTKLTLRTDLAYWVSRCLDWSASQTFVAKYFDPEEHPPTVSIAVADVSVTIARALMKNEIFTESGEYNQETIDFVKGRVPRVPHEKLASLVVSGPYELGTYFQSAVEETKHPIFEKKICGIWVPLAEPEIRCNESRYGQSCSIHADVRFVDQTKKVYASIWDDTWADKGGAKTSTKRSVADVLADFDMRVYDPARADAFRADMARARKLSEKPGRVVLVSGHTLQVEEYESGFSGQTYREIQERDLGFKQVRAVVDPELEIVPDDDEGDPVTPNRFYTEKESTPFVRVFLLKQKRYAYVPVGQVSEYDFQEGVLDRLKLPEHQLSILRGVFESEEETFADVVEDKSGGMVILANGNPGVGKTLTAEIFAEHTKRPLYALEVAELGTSLETVEQRLRIVFNRAARWNAVLLFDEADIFLMKRDDNLERSAIVGVFLRLLDYYPGLMFLTTNRAETIDPAFASRITLRIDYPDLSPEVRVKVWSLMLRTAGVKVNWTPEELERIADVPLNGRSIRNAVRLLRKITPKGTEVGAAEIERVLSFNTGVRKDEPVESATEIS